MNGGKHNFTNVGAVREAKDPLDLVKSDVLHDVNHIFVELSSHLLKIGKYVGLVHVKSQGDDVFGVLEGQPFGVPHLQVFPEELLVVGQLNDQWHVERFLQPPGR